MTISGHTNKHDEHFAASRHEWDGGYPYRACKRCKTLDLGKPQPCRGWYFGEDGERIYVEATR